MSAAARTRPIAPRLPRRVSGPPASAPASASGLATGSPSARLGAPSPASPRRPRAAPPPTPSTGAFERLLTLPDHRLVDRILRGRAWVWLIGLGLMGIVAMQVSLLKLNTGISRAVEATSTLERQNADLEASIARLSSGERIRAAAERNGMVTPPAGALRYLQVRPEQDPRRAAARMRPPSQAARELMANGGRVPGALAALPPPSVPAGSVAVPGAEGATIVTPAPAAGGAAPVGGQATPSPAATPVPVQPAAPTPAATAPGTGGTTAATPAGPQG